MGKGGKIVLIVVLLILAVVIGYSRGKKYFQPMGGPSTPATEEVAP